MTGEVSEHTPEVVIYSDASQGDATEVASFNVEIADTPAERSRGLMHRPDMEDGWGMLFIYPNEASRRFWMKNTLIPLDMLFIRADKTVADPDGATLGRCRQIRTRNHRRRGERPRN